MAGTSVLNQENHMNKRPLNRDTFRQKCNAARVRTNDLVCARQTHYQLRHADLNLLSKWSNEMEIWQNLEKRNATQIMIFFPHYTWAENILPTTD